MILPTRRLPALVFTAFLLCNATSVSAGLLDDILRPTPTICSQVGFAGEEELRRIETTGRSAAAAGNYAEANRALQRLQTEVSARQSAFRREEDRYYDLLRRVIRRPQYAEPMRAVHQRNTRASRDRLELETGARGAMGLAAIRARLAELRKVTRPRNEAEHRRWLQEVTRLEDDYKRLTESTEKVEREFVRNDREFERINKQMKADDPELSAAWADMEAGRLQVEEAQKRLDAAWATIRELRLAKDVSEISAEDLRACIAERRRVLAAAGATQPPAPAPPPPAPPVAAPKPPPPPAPPPAPRAPSLSLAGKWTGGCQGVSFGIAGAFNITVANGILSGGFSGGWGNGRLTGTVQSDGRLSAGNGADGVVRVTWTGKVSQRDDGSWQGTGNWTSTMPERSCSGLWSS